MKNMEFMLIIVLIVSLAYPFHPVSGRGGCPPEIELPDPVLFEVTPYVSNGSLVFGLDVYYFYQSYEGMCPISSETDRLECLNADALDFTVHYRVMGGNLTGKLGEAQGIPLETYPLNLTKGTVVIDLNGSKVSFSFNLLRRYLSSLNISGMLADHIYSNDLKPLVGRFNISGVVKRMRAFSYGGRIYVYFPQVQLVDCRDFIPERFYSGGRYVSPIIPLRFSNSTPVIPPLILEYRNGTMKSALKLKTKRMKGEYGGYYYKCSLPNLKLPKIVEPPAMSFGGRNYTYVNIEPGKVEVSMGSFTNGTITLFLMNMTVGGILIPGAPNEYGDMGYTLLFGYNGSLFQVDLRSILRQFNPPARDEYGNPTFYFGGADDEIFHLGVAFIDRKPYLGVREDGSQNVTLIRFFPEKGEWIKNGSVSPKIWDEFVAGSVKGKRLTNISTYSKYFLSVPTLNYVHVKGGTFVYPRKYSVDFSGLPHGYARVGDRILPTCSLWPIYSFSGNGTVYGLFRVQGNFTVYPELVKYRKAPTKTSTPPMTKTATSSTKPPKSTAGEQKSICGPGVIVLIALSARGFKAR